MKAFEEMISLYKKQPDIEFLLISGAYSTSAKNGIAACRELMACALQQKIPMPIFTSTIAEFDANGTKPDRNSYNSGAKRLFCGTYI